ncbi:MAG: hypothetical protein JWQ04_504 [Pedosphaera sp.]|nr:hypothetical protein [Pedosphaera sp.]
MNSRFTMDGSDALENQLAQTCRGILSGVQQIVPPSALEGLVLGGGYGRGQGGVLKTSDGDRPYNDLEFYVFIRGNILLADQRHRAALRELGERLSPQAGLHVEFKVHSLDKLRCSGVSMFSYDLMAGHKIIFGDGNMFQGCEHHLAADRIPDSEAARLLFNRCSGLLLARDFLRQPMLTAEQMDFVGRNLAKAQLGFGDAVLTVFGHYHWNCRERRARLLKLKSSPLLPDLAEVRRHHAEGVEFKLHPRRGCTRSKSEFELLFTELHSLGRQLWLWSESRRLNHAFASARDYALAGVGKCPETPAWRNGLLGLKTFGARALLDGRLFRYPRERLFDALCLLLWDEDAVNEPALMQRLQNHLSARSACWQDLMLAYRCLWENYG